MKTVRPKLLLDAATAHASSSATQHLGTGLGQQGLAQRPQAQKGSPCRILGVVLMPFHHIIWLLP